MPLLATSAGQLAGHFAGQLVMATDPIPSDNNVKAGWGALALVLVLIAAVVFLFFSFSKQMKRVEAANDAGVYGEDDKAPRRSSTDDD